MDFKLFPSFPTQLLANKQLAILLCYLNASHSSFRFSEYSIRRALMGLLSLLLTSNFGVNFGAGRTNITTGGVDINELILELAFSPVRDPIP